MVRLSSPAPLSRSPSLRLLPSFISYRSLLTAPRIRWSRMPPVRSSLPPLLSLPSPTDSPVIVQFSPPSASSRKRTASTISGVHPFRFLAPRHSLTKPFSRLVADYRFKLLSERFAIVAKQLEEKKASFGPDDDADGKGGSEVVRSPAFYLFYLSTDDRFLLAGQRRGDEQGSPFCLPSSFSHPELTSSHPISRLYHSGLTSKSPTFRRRKRNT